jgi:hypothetical protein
LSPLLLCSDALRVGVAGDQAVVSVTECKEVDPVSYTALLLWEAKELLSQINSVDVLPPFVPISHIILPSHLGFQIGSGLQDSQPKP